MADEATANSEIWQDDLLGRQKDAEFLINFLVRRIEERADEGRPRSYVLNLDAKWGDGKTFFLDRLAKQLVRENFLMAYVNVWEDDHADDPIIAVMSAIDSAVQKHIGKNKALKQTLGALKQSGVEIAFTVAKHGVKKAVSRLAGDGLEEASEIIEDVGFSGDQNEIEETSSSNGEETAKPVVEKLIDRHADEVFKRFKQNKNSVDRFRKSLGSLLENITRKGKEKAPLFVLIDEADRCRPSYAITLLERIKHLFEIDNVVFIVATDTQQLQHSIKAIYGQGFDSKRYLLRFFDRSYVFEKPDVREFVANLFNIYAIDTELFSSPPKNEHEEFFSNFMVHLNISLRDAEQCFDMLRSIMTIWPYKVKIELLYLLPLITAFQGGRTEFLEALYARDNSKVRDYLDDKRNWRIAFEAVDDFGRPKKPENVGFPTLISSFLASSLHDLSSIGRTDNDSALNSWISQRFREELSLLHSNQYRQGSPPMSVVERYPEFVRNVGRLSRTPAPTE